MGVTPARAAGESLESTLSTGAARAARAARRGKRSLTVTRTMTEPQRDRSDEAQKIRTSFYPRSYTQKPTEAHKRTYRGLNQEARAPGGWFVALVEHNTGLRRTAKRYGPPLERMVEHISPWSPSVSDRFSWHYPSSALGGRHIQCRRFKTTLQEIKVIGRQNVFTGPALTSTLQLLALVCVKSTGFDWISF